MSASLLIEKEEKTHVAPPPEHVCVQCAIKRLGEILTFLGPIVDDAAVDRVDLMLAAYLRQRGFVAGIAQ